jgi:PAS domain S-box-containing protein
MTGKKKTIKRPPPKSALKTGRKKSASKIGKCISAEDQRTADIFNAVFYLNPIPTAITSVSDGIFVEINKAFSDFSGYPYDELCTGYTSTIDIWEKTDDRDSMVRLLREKGTVPDFVVKIRTKNGELRNCILSANLIMIEGEPFVLSTARDVTESVRARQELRESEEKYRLLIENMSDILWVLDLATMKIVYTSPSGFDILGYSREEAISLGVTDLVAPDQIEMVARVLADELANDRNPGVDPNRTWTHEVKQLHRNGSIVWTEMTVKFLRDDSGKPVKIFGVSRNVSERKQAEEELKNIQDAYRKVIENSPVGFFKTSPPGKFVVVNPAMARLFGYDSVEEFREQLNDNASQIYYNSEDQKHFLSLMQTYKEFNGVEFLCKNKKGEPFWVMASCLAFVNEKDEIISIEGFFIDISERKRAEDSRRAVQERLQATMEALPDLLFEVSSDGRIYEFSASNLDELYIPPDQFLGKRIPEIVPPEAAEVIMSAITEAARTGKHLGADYYLDYPDGRRWYELSIAAKGDPGADNARFIVLARDITESKKNIDALRRSEEHLRETLKEKEVLLREIHHRVKNNMQIISSLLGLQAAYASDSRDSRLFEVSQNRVRSMALVHEKLYQSESLAGLDFQDYITDLTKELTATYLLSGKADILVNAKNTFVAIDDIIPCSLIIYELVSNAMKHAFPGDRNGTITIDLYRDGDDNVLRIGDNGTGLPPGFDYHNTETLGLRLVDALAKQLKGAVKLDSGDGTVFTVRFRGQTK